MRNSQVLIQVQSGICDAELHPELVGLKGGIKQNWLRQHIPDIVKYHHVYGPSRTKQHYGIKLDSTLDRILTSSPIAKIRESELALLKAEQAVDAWRSATHRIDNLEAEVNGMRPMAKLGVALVEALCKYIPGVEYHPPVVRAPDRLRLE